MNKPLVVPAACDSESSLRRNGSPAVQKVPPSAPSLKKETLGRKLILVRPFRDRRCPAGEASCQTQTPHLDSRPPDLCDGRRIDRFVIAQVFVSALRRAGFEAMLEPKAGRQHWASTPRPTVLEGELWSFSFETHATTILDVDLTLLLKDACDPGAAWKLEFPGDQAVPLWIGLGCRPENMVAAALNEVAEAALPHFKSDAFRAALLAGGELPLPEPRRVESSHEVVSESSWTGTERGAIAAMAHEADLPELGERLRTAALYEPAY